MNWGVFILRVLAVVAIVYAFWMVLVRLGREVYGDVPTYLNEVELSKRGYRLCMAASPALMHDANVSLLSLGETSLWTSTDFFLSLRRQGVLSAEEIGMIGRPDVGIWDASRPDRKTVAWNVVVGVNGAVFSPSNRPTANTPFLVSRGLLNNPWTPALPRKLKSSECVVPDKIALITFCGEVFWLSETEVKSMRCLPEEMLNVSNKYILIWP